MRHGELNMTKGGHLEKWAEEIAELWRYGERAKAINRFVVEINSGRAWVAAFLAGQVMCELVQKGERQDAESFLEWIQNRAIQSMK